MTLQTDVFSAVKSMKPPNATKTSSFLPFFGALAQYVYKGKSQFDCPGHQGGAYFRRHPAGRAFYDFFGEELFRSDLCNADVAMGDLLIHEGAPLTAQKLPLRYSMPIRLISF